MGFQVLSNNDWDSKPTTNKRLDFDQKNRRTFIPQQRELLGSSAQNSSGVHWCRRRVRFKEVLEKVPKVTEKVWEALVQSQVTFIRVPEKVPQKVWEALVQSPVRFNRVPKKVPRSLGGKWSQVQQGSGEGPGGALVQSQVTRFRRRLRRRFERLWCRARSSSTGFRRKFQWTSGRLWRRARWGSTGFRRRFRRRSGRLWCRARSGSTGLRRRRRLREVLVQRQVRFNRVPEKVPGSLGGKRSQVQQGSGEGPGEALVQSQVTRFRRRLRRRFERLWCGARSSSIGFRRKFQWTSGRLWRGARWGSTGFRRRFQRRSGRLWCRARSGSTGLRRRRRLREVLVQHQVRFISVLDKVPEKVWPGQIQQGSGEGSGEGSRKPWCKAKSISTGSGEGCRAGPGEGFLGIFGAGPGQDRVSSAWLRSTLQTEANFLRCFWHVFSPTVQANGVFSSQ